MVPRSSPGRCTVESDGVIPVRFDTGMGDRLWAGIPPWYVTSHRPTQPPTLCGMGNEYRPKCGDALRLGIKGRISAWVASVTVIPR